MGQSHDDLADLLDTPEALAPGKAEDLLSQMAGDSIDRMMSGEFDPIVNPVEELTNQLDTFFEQLQHRRHMKSVAPQALATPDSTESAIRMGATSPREEQFESEMDDLAPAEHARDDFAGADSPSFIGAAGDGGVESPAPARAMLVGFDALEEPAGYLKPLGWFAAPVEAMSWAGRLAVSLAAVASFLSACGTLAWVIALRHAQ